MDRKGAIIQLKDKVVLVTGAGRGLGKELALAFASNGAKLILCALEENEVKSVQSEIIASGGRCDYYSCDLSNEKSVNSFADDVLKKNGAVDVVINSAGYVNDLNPLEQNTTNEFVKNFEINVFSIFYLLRKLLPSMKSRKTGAIVNIASYAGKRGVPRLAAYSASKFAVVGLTQAVAKECADLGVKCVAVCPGGINTTMRSKLFGEEDANKQQSPAFVANVIVDVVTGKVDVPNGGDIVVRYGKITEINVPPIN